MRTEIHSLWKEERGGSVAIGAILMLLIVVAMWGTIQAYYVPDWNEDVEYEHLNIVHDDMIMFKSDVEDVAISEVPKSSDFRMGVRYPNRMFLANPGAGVAGSLTSENVSVSIVYIIDAVGDPMITTNYASNRIIYEVQGTVDSPKLVYEHGVVIRDYGNEYATTDEQSLIIGDEIFIPVLTGNLTASSSMETESIALKPLTASYSRDNIKSVTITLNTAYPQVWEDLLAGTSTADTTVSVNQTQNQITITSTAIRQINFAAGDMTADALYAGMVTLSTTTDAGDTSIDINQDYPGFLYIDIEVAGVGNYKKTHSTITVTVKNATAPFDIRADLANLTNDPEMYNVMPDYSSPDSISATSWELPNENEVRWTDIEHPEYDGDVTIIVTFFVRNTENNMQYFAIRAFDRQGATSW